MSSQKLRIVHTESSCGWGGQELRILAESEGLLARGHQVEIVCCPESIIAAKACERGIPVTTLPIRRRNFEGLVAARMWLARHHVDIVNTHSSSDSWLFTVAARTAMSRPRIVRTRHIGARVKPSVASNWIYASGADFLVTCGQNMRRQLIESNGVDSTRSRSTPTGIKLSRFVPGDVVAAKTRIGLDPQRKIVGIVAALRSEKGHQDLFKATQSLSRDDFDVLIVGDGPAKSWIESLAAQSGLNDRVHFVGNQDDVVPYLQAIDLFALPSTAVEGVPQSIMQAMACRLPVLATDIGSIEQAVTHNVTGLLVEPGCPDQLAQALQELLDDDGKRSRFAENGLSKAKAEFSIETMLDDMEEVFYFVSGRQTAIAA